MTPVIAGIGLSIAAYLVGSAPTAYFLTRFARGVDIREIGSRNPGAVNVFREVGVWAGLAVLGVDAAKGAAVVLAVSMLDLGDYSMFGAALAIVIGHNWPVFLGFRGGKGVAVIFGLSLAILPLITLASAGLSLAAGLGTRNVVFGIGVGVVAINVLTVSTRQPGSQVTLCLTLSAIVVATHYALSYREVVEAVRNKGPWGLFEVE